MISTAPHNGDNMDLSLCVVACFDAVIAYTTPAYVSMDMPRSVTLVYRSTWAKPMPVVQVDAADNSDTPPAKMSIRLRRPDNSYVTFANGSTQIFFQGATGTSRLAAQFDGSGLTTGIYDYTVEIRSHWTDNTVLQSNASVRILLVNDSGSPYGAGWQVGGVQRIYRRGTEVGSDVLLVDGDGSARYFIGCDEGGERCTLDSPPGDFTTLTEIRQLDRDGNPTRVTGFERSYPDGTLATYSTSRLTSIRDRFNNQTSLTYAVGGGVQTITDPAGKVLTLSYSTGNKLSAITDPGSPARVTAITVNAAGDLTEILDPGGLYGLRASYDASHRMTSRIDRRGGQWTFAYDFAGKVAADSTPAVVADGVSQRLVARFKSLESTVLPPADSGSIVNPVGRRDTVNIRASVVNARGALTKYKLDRWGAATRIEEPYGRLTSVTRNASGQVTQTVSPAADTVDLTWIGLWLASTRNRALQKTVSMTYEPTYNEIIQVSGDADSVWAWWSGGRLDSVRVGSSTKGKTKFWYDSRGRDTLVRDPAGHEKRTYYASGGWMNADSVKAATRRTAFTYDGYGRTITTKDPSNYVTTVAYDWINRVTRVIGPLADPDTTLYGYDALYQTTVTDAKGQVYKVVRNALGWAESDTFPVPAGVSAGRRYAYDRSGNATSGINRRGQAVSFTYDSLDNVITRTADGLTTAYVTDPLGLFLAASNAESVDTTRFDRAGRAIAEIAIRSGTRYELVSTHDARDLRKMLRAVSPWSDTVRYTYTAAMELDSLVDLAGGMSRFVSDEHRFRTGTTLPNAITVSRTYPSVHAPGGVTYSASSVNEGIGMKFSFDSRGLVYEQMIVSLDSGVDYQYDERRRLARARHFVVDPDNRCRDTVEGVDCSSSHKTVTATQVYTYDKVGNRTDLGAVVAVGNRLVRLNGDSLVYDADGNLIKRIPSGSEIQRLYWNSLSQLVAVWTSGSDSVNFTYDGWGRRARKWSATSTTQFVWDGAHLFAELDGSGNRVAEYTYHPGVDWPHSVRRGGRSGDVYYYGTDHLGAVAGLIDASGALAKSYDYGPWGNTERESGSLTNSLRFGAREHDAETGLYYLRARYYDPALGRFISEDPIGLGGGVNLYLYAANNPTNLTDPTGLDWECQKKTKKIPTDQGEVEVEVISCKWTETGTLSFGDILRLASGVNVTTYSSGQTFTIGGVTFVAMNAGAEVRYARLGDQVLVGLTGEVRAQFDWLPDVFVKYAAFNLTTGHYAVLGDANLPLQPTLLLVGNRSTGEFTLKWGVVPIVTRPGTPTKPGQ